MMTKMIFNKITIIYNLVHKDNQFCNNKIININNLKINSFNKHFLNSKMINI